MLQDEERLRIELCALHAATGALNVDVMSLIRFHLNCGLNLSTSKAEKCLKISFLCKLGCVRIFC